VIPRLYRLVLIPIRHVHLVSDIDLLLEMLAQDDLVPLVIHPQLLEYMVTHETWIVTLGRVLGSQVFVGH
jgi:hypothetical protein